MSIEDVLGIDGVVSEVIDEREKVVISRIIPKTGTIRMARVIVVKQCCCLIIGDDLHATKTNRILFCDG